MKKLISIVLTLAMLMSISVPMLVNASAWPGSDAMYVLDSFEGFSALSTTSRPMIASNVASVEMASGMLGKSSVDTLAKISDKASTKYYFLHYEHNEEIYLEDGNALDGYLVVDLNFYSDDPKFQFFRFGLSYSQTEMTKSVYPEDLINNQWNHLRMVYQPPATCTDYSDNKPTTGANLGTTTLYINGSKINTKTISASQNMNPIDRILLMVYNGDNTASHYAYMDDLKVYKTTSDPGAPARVALADGENYFAVNKTSEIVYSGDITLADIKAANPGVEMFAFDNSAYSNQLTDDTVLAEGNVISTKSTDGLYTAYSVKSNQWTDDRGNTYTWSFSNDTKEFSLGILDTEKGKENYGKISCDFSTKTRPWIGITGLATSISIDKGITGLARQTFEGFVALEEVTIPAHITTWAWGTFSNCVNLKTVNYEEGCSTTGGDKMFVGCTSLATVNLPTTLNKISARAFSGCKSLSELLVPPLVDTIPYSVNASAFEGCTIKLKYYKNSKASEIIKQDYVNSDGSAVAVTYEELTGGTLPDKDGNADSIAWNIDENGVLTISDIADVGTGRMHLPLNSKEQLPWNSISGYTKIVVEDGITHLCWNLLNTGFAISEIVIPASVETAESYSLNYGNVDSLIFEEGANKILTKKELLNRNVKLNNLYIPSSAENIPSDFIRSLGTDNSLEFNGNPVLNVYAQEGTAGYKWALDRKAHSKDSYAGEYDLSVAPERADFATDDDYNKVLYMYKSVQTVNVYPTLVINNDGTTASIMNNSKAPITGDVIIAYYKGDEMTKAELLRNKILEIGDNTITFDTSAGDPIIYLWESIDTLVPMAKNK